MNRRPLVLKPSIAVSGFLQMKTAEGLSPNTLLSYKHLRSVWVSQITIGQIALLLKSIEYQYMKIYIHGSSGATSA